MYSPCMLMHSYNALCDQLQGAQEPHKFMGHGECDNFSRSQTLAAATDDGAVLGTAAVALLAGLRCPPTEIRGLGLHVSRLFDAATGAALGDAASGSTATIKVRTLNTTHQLHFMLDVCVQVKCSSGCA
jgi:impB/mucB/samB family C-terminal domain